MTTPPREGWPKRYGTAARAAGFPTWDAWVAEREAALGRTICGRMLGKKSKRPGTPCEKGEGSGCRRMKGPIGACKEHNGDTPAGPASPQWRTGAHSRAPSVVKRSLRERMEDQPDPIRLLRMTGALLMARLEELVDRIDAGAIGPTALAGARGILQQMGKASDPADMARLLGELRATIEGGAAVDDVWRGEMYETIELIGRHADRWRKVLIDAREMIPRDRALLLIDRFGEAALEVINGLPITAEQKLQARRDLAATIALTMNGRALPTVPPRGDDD